MKPPKCIQDDMQGVSQLLRGLTLNGERDSSTLGGGSIQKVRIWAEDNFPGERVTRHSIKDWIPTQDRLNVGLLPQSYIELKPTRDKALPLLTYSVDFRKTLPTARFGLILIWDPGHGSTDCETVGMRWESPHGPGEHHYYHMQWFHTQPAIEAAFPGAHVLPVHYPAVPVHARNSAELLASLTLSLYGLNDSAPLIDDALTTPSWSSVVRGPKRRHFSLKSKDGATATASAAPTEYKVWDDKKSERRREGWVRKRSQNIASAEEFGTAPNSSSPDVHWDGSGIGWST